MTLVQCVGQIVDALRRGAIGEARTAADRAEKMGAVDEFFARILLDRYIWCMLSEGPSQRDPESLKWIAEQHHADGDDLPLWEEDHTIVGVFEAIYDPQVSLESVAHTLEILDTAFSLSRPDKDMVKQAWDSRTDRAFQSDIGRRIERILYGR